MVQTDTVSIRESALYGRLSVYASDWCLIDGTNHELVNSRKTDSKPEKNGFNITIIFNFNFLNTHVLLGLYRQKPSNSKMTIEIDLTTFAILCHVE